MQESETGFVPLNQWLTSAYLQLPQHTHYLLHILRVPIVIREDDVMGSKYNIYYWAVLNVRSPSVYLHTAQWRIILFTNLLISGRQKYWLLKNAQCPISYKLFKYKAKLIGLLMLKSAPNIRNTWQANVPAYSTLYVRHKLSTVWLIMSLHTFLPNRSFSIALSQWQCI
jgi:hypothetical protein